MEIQRSHDFEDLVREILAPYLTAYVRPLPADFALPSVLVTWVGGTARNGIDTADLTLDARAEREAEASETLRNALGILRAAAKAGDTEIRHVSVNASGSWGKDPARPDIAMCTARVTVTGHLEKINLEEKS